MTDSTTAPARGPEWFAAQRFLVTGGAGFLGRRICQQLRRSGATEVFAPRSAEYDLRTMAACEAVLETTRPTVVIHAAAVVGGIGANAAHPGSFFYDNASMGIHMIEASRRFGVAKFVAVGTVCAYPKFTATPFSEDALWDGYPEETNAPYGLAKKMLLVQLQGYRAQYGMNGVFVLPANLYGPGDNFEEASSHVIPALIRKAVEALETGADSIPVWGTGEPSREFLYVDDAARGIVMAAASYDSPEPVNLGTGAEVRIRDLATLIAREVGFEGRLEFDASKPDGQPRRRLETSRARNAFGFEATTPLEAGLRVTIDWYRLVRSQPDVDERAVPDTSAVEAAGVGVR